MPLYSTQLNELMLGVRFRSFLRQSQDLRKRDLGWPLSGTIENRCLWLLGLLHILSRRHSTEIWRQFLSFLFLCSLDSSECSGLCILLQALNFQLNGCKCLTFIQLDSITAPFLESHNFPKKRHLNMVIADEVSKCILYMQIAYY